MKKLKICLINPPAILTRKGSAKPYQPLGLCYVAAVLEKNGYDVVVIDAVISGVKKINDFVEPGEPEKESKKYCGLSYEEIADEVRALSPDVVGISVPFSTQVESAYRVAAAVKSVDKNIAVVVGGPHPTVRPESCLAHRDIDFVVIGEGECTMLELVQKLETMKAGEKEKLKDVKGIAFMENGEFVATPAREFIRDLDSLPFPARRLLPMEEYFRAAESHEIAREASKRWTTVITSRGCPYNCVFCSIRLSMGQSWRARSPENVIDEIEQLVDEYGIEQVIFEDDNMTLDRKRMERICDLIVERIVGRGLKLEWYTPNGIRADTLDESLLLKMKSAGCKGITIAPESGNQRVVNEIIGKRLDLKKVEEVVRLCKKIGMPVGCFFVVGLIGERKENFMDTLKFSVRLRNLGASCGFVPIIALPYYGTRLYEQARENGYLKLGDGKDLEYALLNFDPTIETPEFTRDDLYDVSKKWKRAYLLHAVTHPRVAASKIGHVLKSARNLMRTV